MNRFRRDPADVSHRHGEMVLSARSRILGLVGVTLLIAACSPTSTTAALADELEMGSDGWYGIPIDDPIPMPDLVLTDTHGAEYDLRAGADGRPTLLFFGYGSCPDICPVHLAVLARAMEEAQVTTDDIQVVFVSVDPERDTPESLGQYVESFNSGFVGLTGDLDATRAALRSLRLPEPTYSEPDENGFYIVGHPAAFLAFDADGMARRQYPFGTRSAQWVHDLPLILDGET